MTNETKAKIDFVAFLSGLMVEGMIAMGIVENPVTQKAEKNLDHAQMVIDTVSMLKDKTKGNLSVVEESKVDDILHQMRMAYVASLEGKTEAKEANDEQKKSDQKVEDNEK